MAALAIATVAAALLVLAALAAAAATTVALQALICRVPAFLYKIACLAIVKAEAIVYIAELLLLRDLSKVNIHCIDIYSVRVSRLATAIIITVTIIATIAYLLQIVFTFQVDY